MRVDNLDTGDKSLAYANLPLGEWDPVETRNLKIYLRTAMFFPAFCALNYDVGL